MERRTLRTLWGCAGACRALLAFTHLGPAEDRLANEQQQNQKFRRELLIFRDAKDAFLVCDVLCPLLLHEKLVPAMVSVERPCCVRNTRDVWPSCYSCVPSRRTRPCCVRGVVRQEGGGGERRTSKGKAQAWQKWIHTAAISEKQLHRQRFQSD